MTIRARIIGDEEWVSQGWVEVDPFDYQYDGPDPDGEIESYLSDVADGTVEYGWPQEYEGDDADYPPDLKMIAIKEALQDFEPIWFVDLPDDFETSISYG